MRIPFQAVATILLGSLILGAMLMFKINLDWANKVETMRGDVVARFFVEGARDDIPEADAFRAAAYMWLVLGITSLAGIYAVFIRKQRLAIWIAIALILFASTVVLLQPSMANINGNNPKTTGMGIAFFGILGMLLILVLQTTLKSEPAAREMLKRK